MYSRIKEAITLDPLEPTYHLALGNAYLQDNRLDLAIVELQQTIQLSPTSSEPYKLLGRIYMERGDYDKAARLLSDSLKRNKVTNPQQVHNWLAICYFQLGNFAAAEQSWLNALNLREDENIRLNLALAYRDQEQFDKAIQSLQKALENKPQFAPAHFQLALLYLKNKDLVSARHHFNEVVRLDPQSDQAKSSLEYLALIKPAL